MAYDTGQQDAPDYSGGSASPNDPQEQQLAAQQKAANLQPLNYADNLQNAADFQKRISKVATGNPFATDPETERTKADMSRAFAAAVMGNVAPKAPIAEMMGLEHYSANPSDINSNGGINVLNPSGELVSVDPSQLEDALRSGYQKASVEDVHKYEQTQKYGGVGQQIATGLEGAASAATFGGSTAAEVASGITTPEAIRGRRAENPVAHGVGQGLGLAATAFIPGAGEAAGAKAAAEVINPLSAASLLTGAGKAAASAVGLGKPGAGFVSNVSADAVKGAFETALFQGSDELSKAYTQDPDQTAETAIADIGMAAVMGGMFGGTLGAASQGLKKIAAKPIAEGAGEAPAGIGTPNGPEGVFVPSVDRAAYEAGDLKTHIAADPTLPPGKKASLLDAFNLGKRKSNADAIEAAQKELGAPLTPGMTLESPLIQMQVNALAHSPYTYSGNRIGGLLDDAYSSAEGALKKATGSANELSKDQLGQALQSSMTEQTRAAYAPVQAAYDEVSALHPNVPVLPNDVIAFRNGLQGIKEVKLKGTDEGRLANQVLRIVENAKSADDLTTVRNMAALKKTGVGYDPLGHIKGIIRDKLNDMQESAVSRYAKSFPRNDEAGAMMANVVQMNDAAKAMYKPYIRKLGELSEWLGKGKIHGTEDALSFMNERLSASDVAQRLFSASKDPQFLRFFSKEFPEQFQMIRDYQRMALREAATTGDHFSPKLFFNKFNKLEPELQRALYSKEEIKKIAAAETYIRDAFPKNFNPSGSSHGIALREAYSSPKSMIYANARDLAMEKFINAAGNYDAANAASLAKSTVKGHNLLVNSVRAIFKRDAEIPSAISGVSEAKRSKLDKLVKEFVEDPAKMLNLGANNPVESYSTAFSAAAARSVQYLDSMRPKLEPAAPLDRKPSANSVETAKYNRALSIAEQPLTVLAHIKAGTLTAQDVISITTMYPKLYNSLVQQVQENLVTSLSKGGTIPYSTRLGLATFLGKPLDSSMTPQGIMGAQPTPSAPQQPQIQKPKRGTANLSKMPGLYQTPEQARQSSKH